MAEKLARALDVCLIGGFAIVVGGVIAGWILVSVGAL